MTVLASADTKLLWQISLCIGVVVIVVVILLMALLLSFIKDIEAEAEGLISIGGGLSTNTSEIVKLATTVAVLEEIKEEALIQGDYLSTQVPQS
jgi:hypothetical protein